MHTTVKTLLAAAFVAALGASTSADQTPALSRVMRDKLGHSQAILAAVIRSDWASLDKESRALALAVRDPAWFAALSEPEYLRQSDAFSKALQNLIESAGRRDLEAAAQAQVDLTITCVQCHLHMTRRRLAKPK
jgi:hypothetical protein